MGTESLDIKITNLRHAFHCLEDELEAMIDEQQQEEVNIDLLYSIEKKLLSGNNLAALELVRAEIYNRNKERVTAG